MLDDAGGLVNQQGPTAAWSSECVEQSRRPHCVKGVYAHHISADTIVC